MNRRLLSTTLPLSALLATVTLAAPRTTLASPSAALPARVLSNLALGFQAADPDAEYNQGVTDYNAGNYDSAIAHFTNALKGRASFVDANFNRGLAYEGKKDWKSAIADFTKVIAKRPQMYDAYVERGRSYAMSGDFADGQKDLAQATTLKPTRPDAFQVLGDASFNNKDYDAAIAAYTKYLTLSVDTKPDPLIYDNRGLANFSAKHYEAAIADFNKFTALDPKDATETGLFLGDAYTALKQYPAAIKAYSAYITSHPNDATGSALMSRGLAEYQAAMYKEAAADFKAFLVIHPNDKTANTDYLAALAKAGGLSIPVLEAAVKNDPSNVTIRTQLAKALFEAKRFPEAIEQYNTILAAQPTDSASIFNRGLAYSQTGDHAKATADFLAYTAAKPSEAPGWRSLGIEYGQASNWKGAIEAFTKYISLASAADSVDAYKDRGIAEYNLKDYKAANADLKKYDASKPNDAQVGKLIAETSIAIGDTTGALDTLLGQVKKNPTDRTAWFNLGVAYVTLKKYQESIEPFTKAIGLKADELAYFNRGFAYYNLGASTPADYALAAKDATQALMIKPTYAEAQLLLADSEYAQKDYKNAGPAYTKYLGMPNIAATDKTYVQQQLLLNAINLQNYDDVIASTNNLITANPSEPSNYKVRGSAYVAKKNYEAAIPDLLKYTQMKPDDSAGFYALGVAYYNTKQMDKAAESYEKALSIKPDYYDAANNAALAYKALGDANQADPTKATPAYDKAVALFEKAITIKGTGKATADPLFNEAQTYEAKAKVTDTTDPLKLAVPVWERWIIAAPTDPDLPKVKQHVADLKAQIANG